jgi:hypothetical protein
MSKAADEYEDIARRLKELEADRQLALTGSTVPEKVGEAAVNWSYSAALDTDYCC